MRHVLSLRWEVGSLTTFTVAPLFGDYQSQNVCKSTHRLPLLLHQLLVILGWGSGALLLSLTDLLLIIIYRNQITITAVGTEFPHVVSS